YCVKDTAIDSANLGFETVVVMDGTRGISDDLGPTLKEFGENGVLIMNSLDLLDIL
ncbi:MAG: isochorismatase family protein, partial [Candidatus Cloacimonetes bacterium]|nr:isochorismatase family protein [Candidatus Cloacimonadota bacterium]